MYKLSIEFKNNEELATFVAKLGGLPSDVKVDTIKKEEKPVKTKAEKAVAETVAQALEVPPVIATPKTLFNRADAITKATEVIKDLSTLVEGPQLAQHLADVYVEAGCPIGVKISQLEDESLSRFIPLFLQKASALKGYQKPTQSGAFI